MSDIAIVIGAIVSVSVIVGYICWVNATLDKIWDDMSLSHEAKREKVDKEQQEIANIGICMSIPFLALALGFLVIVVTDLILR